MGAAFIEKAMASFKKSWDRERVALATADLFTRAPSCVGRTAVAEIIGDAVLHIGDRVTIEQQGEGLVAMRGNTEVARFTNPSSELVEAVEKSHGAKGSVEQVHDLASVAEISLC